MSSIKKERDVKQAHIDFNESIIYCSKEGQWQKALELLESMEVHGLKPDVVSLNAAMWACEKGGQWQKALEVL